MQTRLKMSRDGLELLKEFEGLRLTAARLPDGRWTMGHGHTQYAREGASITAADAEALLVYDLIPVSAAVNEAVVPQISQNQFDALVCFAFNVGVEAFRESEVLRRVNQERMTEAALAMAIWRAGAFEGRRVVLDALVRRRTAEEALLLGGGASSPSDLVRPEIDPLAEASLPPTPPAEMMLIQAGDAVEAHLVKTVVTPEFPHDPELSTTDMSELVAEDAGAPPTEPDDVGTDDPSNAGDLEPEIEVSQALQTLETTEAGLSDPAEAAVPSEAEVSETAEITEPVDVETAEAETPSMPQVSVSAQIYSNYQTEPFSSLPAVTREPETQAVETATSTQVGPVGEAVDEAVAATSLENDNSPQALVLTPPLEVAAEPMVRANPEETVLAEERILADDQTPLFEGGAATDNDVIFYEPTSEPDNQPARWSDTGAYIATGAVGLAAFGFGIAGFQLAGQDPVPAGLFDEKVAISWVLVAIGVVCVWISAYNLFKRLGGPEAE